MNIYADRGNLLVLERRCRWRGIDFTVTASGLGDALDPGVGRVLAGFENHGGRTRLGPGASALGRVLKGHGNNGEDGYEGVRHGNVIGTYLHGPLLPKNAWFADWLIQAALQVVERLEPLDDHLEAGAHADARRAAGV